MKWPLWISDMSDMFKTGPMYANRVNDWHTCLSMKQKEWLVGRVGWWGTYYYFYPLLIEYFALNSYQNLPFFFR